MKLYSPIKPEYMNNGHTVILNQLFGENRNLLFYGPHGHTGLDIKTTGGVKYERTDDGKGGWVWNGQDWGPHAVWRRIKASAQEENGRIPIVACHDGELTLILHDDKQGLGWGVLITADPELEGGLMEVQYRTLYWHIETPWSSLGMFWGTVKAIPELLRIFSKRRVHALMPIAIGGNNGLSTGPHLHLELERREKWGGVWGPWQEVDPIPYLCGDGELVVYQHYNMSESTFFHKGKEISYAEYKEITKNWPKVI